MERTCPQCRKTYKTVLEPKTDKLIQDEFPSAPAWQREQHLTGICSDSCWDKFLGIGDLSQDDLMFMGNTAFNDGIDDPSIGGNYE